MIDFSVAPFWVSALAWRFGGGLVGVLAGVLIPFIVFNYFIALFVFLHHTHPEVPFFDNRPEWSNTIGQLYCSIVVRCSRLSELLIHNIMIHVPHHVDSKIPFYHLKQAYADLQREYGEFAPVLKLAAPAKTMVAWYEESLAATA